MRGLALLLLLCAFGSAPSQASNVSGTMSVSGSFVGGQPVSYTVVLSNSGTIQNDNAGNEFFVQLPAGLTLVSCTANTGAPAVNLGGNQATWSGSIAAGGTVTITVTATVIPTAVGTVISAQGLALFDADGNGVNDTLAATNDPNTGAPGDATAFTTVARSIVSGTMAVAGIFAGSSNVTYTVVLANAGPLALNDNPSNEFIVTLPATLTLVSCTAKTGDPFANLGNNSASWSGAIPAGGIITITIVATIKPAAPGTVISAQGTILFDRNGDNTNETTVMTDDPNTGAAVDFTTFTTVAKSSVSGTMSVAGIFAPTSNVTYTVVLTNAGPLALNDNPSNEFITTLPSTLTLVSCTANTGEPFANTGNNSASWSGAIPAGGVITITIVATIKPTATGTVINAQGTILFDRNGDNTNEATVMTDDPNTGAFVDATAFTTVAKSIVSGTMAVAGLFAGSSNVTYTVVLTNAGPLALNDNPSNEFIVTLPATLTLVSCTANTGDPFANTGNNSASWSGAIPAGGTITITIVATIKPAAPGTVISAHGTILFDRNGDNTNETTVMTDDPNTGASIDATALTTVAGTDVTGTMGVTGSFHVAGTVRYAVRLQNLGPLVLNDNPSNEFILDLPSSLTLVSCTANTGAPVADIGHNSATWSGSIPANGIVDITVIATIDPVPFGTVIGSQGTVLFDRNGDLTNETARTTDDPGTPAPNDPTLVTVNMFFSNGFEN